MMADPDRPSSCLKMGVGAPWSEPETIRRSIQT
jgi:hypothetical protein